MMRTRMSLMASFIILFDDVNSMFLSFCSSNDVGRCLKHNAPLISAEAAEILLSFLQNSLLCECWGIVPYRVG
jgi:hypothetical protein